jgi:integrase/recombinase XerD
MARNLYAERVNITKYIKHAGQWRFAPVARRASGNIHWDHVLVDGVAEHHPEGKYFIEWREEGARRRRSVGTVPSQVLTEAQRQRALLDARAAGVEVAASGDSPVNRRLLVPDAVERYLRDIRMNKAESTYRHYSHSLVLFRKSLVKATINAIDRDDMMDFQEYLYKLGLSARTVKHKTIIVASFLKSFGVQKLLKKGDWPRYTEDDPESYTPEELKKFFGACTPDEYLLFQFFLQSGLRDAEVRHALWTDLDFNHGTVKVKHKEATAAQSWSFDPKSRRSREVPLPDFLMEILTEAKKESKSKLIFPSRPHSKAPKARPGGKPSEEFLEYCKAIALRASLNCGDCQNYEGKICAVAPCCERFYLHKFRATFATMHLQSGVDIVTVSRWLGHKDIKTTMRYLTAARGEDVRKKVNAGLLASSFSPGKAKKRPASKRRQAPVSKRGLRAVG